MKRRLNIAIGLLHNPLLIIMDEPLVGVDIISKRKIMNKMLKLKSEGRAIVFQAIVQMKLKSYAIALSF